MPEPAPDRSEICHRVDVAALERGRHQVSREESKGRRKRIRAWVASALSLIALAAYAVTLRPAFLGGPVTYVMVRGDSMEPTLSDGDLVVVREGDGYEPGEVIAYYVPEGDPGEGAVVIHRIIGGDPVAGYETQGDNRDDPDLWRPTPDNVAGSKWFHVPDLAHRLLLLRSPVGAASLSALIAFLVVVTYRPPQEKLTGEA